MIQRSEGRRVGSIASRRIASHRVSSCLIVNRNNRNNPIVDTSLGRSTCNTSLTSPTALYDCSTNWTRAAADHGCTVSSGVVPEIMATDVDGDNRADFVCHDRQTLSNTIGYYPIAQMTR